MQDESSNNQIFRIGILMKSLDCSIHISRTIQELSDQPDVELILLKESWAPQSKYQTYRHRLRFGGIRRLISTTAFSLVAKIETRLVSLNNSRIRQLTAPTSVDSSLFTETVQIAPILSKSRLYSRYSHDDIQKIKVADLDMIVRGNGGAILRGKILTASKLGFISFHHGDNRWNRGGPAGFWEVYQQRATTGFIIQMLTNKLDGGHVVFRGAVTTKRTYIENIQHTYAESNPYLSHTILGLLRGEIEMAFEPKVPFDQPVYLTPSLWKTAGYVLRTFGMFGREFVSKRILGREPRWSVGYCQESWREANLAKMKVIKNPRNRYFADPFVVTRNDRTFIFVEDYSYKAHKGTISCVVIDRDNSTKIIENVLEEDFHLSFPYVFEHEGDCYMIPESANARSIRLYRCTNFPNEWEYEMELMSNVAAVDTLVIPYNGKWFLLSNINRFDTSDYYLSQLDVFVSDQLKTTNWRRLGYNHAVFDPEIGRNGGVLYDDDGTVYRVRQAQGFNTYGVGLSIAKITKLSSQEFEENNICSIAPTFKKRIVGTHHMHSHGGVTAIDFVKTERISH